MTDAWVVNASPLILFARVERFDLFEQLAPKFIVPEAVLDEIRAGQAKDPTANGALNWAVQHSLPNLPVPASIEHWDLGAGESQVIAHGLAVSRWVVLDDLAARRCAVAHGLSVIGSLGIVLRAKERGFLSEARPWVNKLKAAGMFVDDGLLNQALAGIGE